MKTFETYWSENWVPTEPASLDKAFREVAEKAWNTAQQEFVEELTRLLDEFYSSNAK